MDVESKYINHAAKGGGPLFFPAEIAILIIKDCKENNLRVLGIDAVKITDTYTQPFMDHSVDYSDMPDIWDEAIEFIESRKHLDLWFEVVISD